MFIDPEPKRPKHSSNGRHSNSGSPFFSSQAPITSPKERMIVKRKPLHERSPSQNNQQKPSRARSPNVRPTVRLVRHSPSPSAKLHSDSEESLHDAKEVHMQKRPGPPVVRLSSSSVLKLASVSKPGLPATRVSDIDDSTNETQLSSQHRQDTLPKLDLPASITLLPTTSTTPVPKTAWHRRSTSSGNYSSGAPTLDNSETASTLVGSVGARTRSGRFSQGTTLRGTPTPYEQDIREQVEADREREQGPAQALQTLQEASPERSTVRAVPPSVKSSSSQHQLRSERSESSLPRPHTRSASDSDTAAPQIPRKSSRRRSSASSIPAPLTVRKVRPSPAPTAPTKQTTQESLAQREPTVPAQPSSPIFVAYSPDSARARSSSQPLYHTTSIESIVSRLQYPSIVRPDTGRSLATSSSWASLQPNSSTDTLPPLQIPKKRLRHKQGSQSLNSQAWSSSSYAGPAYSGHSRMSQEEIDTLPYPRQAFSSHLSTIASESDRTNSRQLSHFSLGTSHFSLGSGVLTGDDASSIPISGTWPRRRRESAPLSTASRLSASESPPIPSAGQSSPEDAGDMTLGIFRAESAKPEPLFKARSESVPADDTRRYDGPLPPLPPIPKSRDSDEAFDTVSELSAPPLKQKRSGYSLRQRSNSTPSHSRGISQVSYDESERGSHGSSIFPTWAKHFYAGTAGLVSASKVSLSSHHTPRPEKRQPHIRNDSSWTERSITSRLGTGYSNISTGSPTSSHFLPSIFRPRTRPRANTEGASRSSKYRRSKKSRPSGEDSRPDSLAIFSDPLPQSRDGSTLPSGQPKWGVLKDDERPPLPPLPRKYSKQKHWDGMEFPRPMTKDRLSDFQLFTPHLAPTKRATNRLSAWQAPSFVESLDTLFKSRGNRQILLFALGFVCPLLWMLAAVLPLPKKPVSASELEKSIGGSEEDVAAAMMKHEAGDAERRWREEKTWLKAKWWRTLNRIMSVVGVLVIGAVIALAIVATRTGM